ncbi:MAG: DUF4271 domain-containing protein [Bacteroidales bacterium]|nr:DUF4271 domain-containing protein [Bacteroidales bacterium]
MTLSIFAWGKAFYYKYLLQILSSVYNYQISIQLFRDKNVLFRNLSIILQILFSINIGLLIFFLLENYNLDQVFTSSSLLNITLYSVGVFLFFKLKSYLYKLLGHLFKVQEDFFEIQHHMNGFAQTLGLVLLPFVIAMPFLEEPLRSIFLYSLFAALGILLMLFFFRGIQIVKRKQVSIFFLILYGFTQIVNSTNKFGTISICNIPFIRRTTEPFFCQTNRLWIQTNQKSYFCCSFFN